MRVKNEDIAEYKVDVTAAKSIMDQQHANEEKVIAHALSILHGRLVKRNTIFNNPNVVRDYLKLNYAQSEQELFSVIYLDAQNAMIAHGVEFQGTLTQCSVYPREIVKSALTNNACAVIFCHNHPSGIAEASNADIALTRTLRDALALVDVRVLDHIIVAGTETVSMAERGLM